MRKLKWIMAGAVAPRLAGLARPPRQTRALGTSSIAPLQRRGLSSTLRLRPEGSAAKPRIASRLLLLLPLALHACTQPDPFELDNVDWDRAVNRTDFTPIKPAYQPLAPDLELPDLDAAQPLQLSVEQATLLTLRHNRDLRVQQLNPVIAGAFEQIERGVFDPELFIEARYHEEESSEATDVTGQQFSVQGDGDTTTAGIRQRFPTGTDVELAATTDRSASSRRPELYESRVGLSVTQSLLRGFGPAANLVDVRQAELDTLASVYELRGFTEALLADTEITYWRYTLAAQRIAIFESSLELARRQLDEIEQSIGVGLVAATEAAAARAQVALREQALIDARSDIEAQRIRLLRLINPSPDNTLDAQVTPTSDPGIPHELLQPVTDLPDRLLLAERSRPDLGEAQLRLEQDRLETVQTRNGLLPRLDLFITLGKTGYADSYSDAWREIDGETYDWAVGVRFSHFIGNRAAKGADLAARATRQQSAAAIVNLRQLIRLDVRLAVNELERARRQITATAATRTLQEETVRAEQERFRVGASTALLVAQAQRDLLESQIAEVGAVIDYRIALVNLYLVEGSLLERRGVRIDGPQG